MRSWISAQVRWHYLAAAAAVALLSVFLESSVPLTRHTEAFSWPTTAAANRAPSSAVRPPQAPASAALRASLEVPAERAMWARAEFDPFQGVPVRPVRQAVAAAASAPVAPLALQGPAAVVAPAPATFRYLGQIVSPTGERAVFLTSGEHSMQVTQGAVLADGWTVERIGPGDVVLVHSATQAKATIHMPAAFDGPN